MADTTYSSPLSAYQSLPVNSEILYEQKQQLTRIVKLDSTSQAEKKDEKLSCSNSEATLAPNLPAPKDQGQSTDYLYYLAEAFASIYKNMTNTTITATHDLSDLQTFDQALVTANVKLTNDAISKQNTEFHANQALIKKEQQEAKSEKIVDDIGLAIGALLIVLTLASAIVDFGASLAAVPEEMTMEMSDAAVTTVSTTADSTVSTTVDTTVDASIDATTTAPEEMTESTTVAEDEAPEYMQQTQDMQGKNSLWQDADEDVQSTTDNSVKSDNDDDVSSDDDETVNNEDSTKEQTKANNQESQDIYKSQEDDVKAQQTRSEDEVNARNNSKWAKAQRLLSNKIYRCSVAVGASAAFTAPMVTQGQASITISKYQKTLYDAQKAVGPAMGRMQANNAILQYFQDVVQRQSGMTSQSIEQLSDVVDIASSIFSAYRQLAVAASQAV